MSESSAGVVAPIKIRFPTAAMSVDAVKRASYVFMPRATVIFDVTNETIECSVQPERQDEDRAALERDFRREVLDQDLRLTIEAQTEPLRTAILGYAFSRTGLQG